MNHISKTVKIIALRCALESEFPVKNIKLLYESGLISRLCCNFILAGAFKK